jgi:hypothetical protein
MIRLYNFNEDVLHQDELKRATIQELQSTLRQKAKVEYSRGGMVSPSSSNDVMIHRNEMVVSAFDIANRSNYASGNFYHIDVSVPNNIGNIIITDTNSY